MTKPLEQVSQSRPGASTALSAPLAATCRATRIVALAWIVWGAYSVFWVVSDRTRVADIYGRLLKLDLAGYSSSQHIGVTAVLIADLAMSAMVAVLVWRLFGKFLAGRILDIATADDMRCLGIAGVAALLADIAARPAVAAIVSAHVASTGPRFDVWGQPNDLLHIMMALFIVVLASVLRSGVAIAEEHRQIV